MKIVTIFAMGTNGELALPKGDNSNYGLPWERSKEDMEFVSDKIRFHSGTNSAIMMTTATWESLPTKLKDLLEAIYLKVILLGGNGNIQLPIAKYIPEVWEQMVHKAVDLCVPISKVKTLVYFGSPKFLDSMVLISDTTYVTIFRDVKETNIALKFDTRKFLLETCPLTLLKKLDNGRVLEIKSKYYEKV